MLASLAAARTSSLAAAGATTAEAINGGYHLAFVLGAICAAAAALIGWTVIRARQAVEATNGDLAPAE